MSVQIGGIRHRGTPTSSSTGAAWNPYTTQQYWEPDTTFMLDPTNEATLTPGQNGMMVGRQSTTKSGGSYVIEPVWQSTSRVQAVTGKYLNGITALPGDSSSIKVYDFLWMPCNGILPTNEFTVEFWAKSPSTAWASLTNQFLFSVGGWNVVSSSVYNTFYIKVTAHTLTATLQHNMGDGAGGVTVNKSATYNFNATSAIKPAAGEWHNIAVTLKNGTLTLYLDATPPGSTAPSQTTQSVTGVVPPPVWGCTGTPLQADGLTIGGWHGVAASSFVISDVRVSRQARTPGVAILPNGSNTITVDTTSAPANLTNTGLTPNTTVNKKLLGGLHAQTYGDSTATALVTGNVNVIRTDKWLTATPMKVGGVGVSADSTYPTAGTNVDGFGNPLYYYDWQVVDRTLDYIASLGCELYVSIDSTPYILGGQYAPFSGTNLTSLLAGDASFAKQIPSNSGSPGVPGGASSSSADFSKFATIAQDFVYHVVAHAAQQGYSAPKYWGVWNEPFGSSTFWAGTQADYFNMYAAVAPAIKAVSSNFKVGGPELAQYGDTTGQPASEAFIQYCHTNSIPLDFISWHYYFCDLTELYQARLDIDHTASTYGMSLEMIVGEGIGYHDAGAPLMSQYLYNLNDFNAAWVATSLIIMQSLNVVYNIRTSLMFDASSNPSSLVYMDAATTTLNVYKMWNLLAANVRKTTVQGDAGIWAIASTANSDGSGQLTILVSSLHYRGNDLPINILIPGLSGSARVTAYYVVDSAHSNAQDAGSSHANLESPSPPLIGGQINITAKARSVHLLVIQS